MTATIREIGTRLRPRICAALALIAVGIVADAAVGLALLRGAGGILWLAHPLAALVWATGSSLHEGEGIARSVRAVWAVVRRCAASPDAPDGEHTPGDARPAVMLGVAIVLFPGFGPIAASLALGLTALPFMARRERALPPLEPEGIVVPLPIEGAAPLLALAVEPIVDVVATADATAKRAAISLLGRQFDREAVHVLRGLLTDADPDVRSEASVTLFQFEDLLTRAVNEATARCTAEPTAAREAELAQAFARLVEVGLVDGLGARSYREQARDAFVRAVALESGAAAYRVALARVQRDLGDYEAAAAALDAALACDPGNVSAHVLRLEIAYAQRRWDVIADADIPEVVGDDETIRWWRDPAYTGRGLPQAIGGKG